MLPIQDVYHPSRTCPLQSPNSPVFGRLFRQLLLSGGCENARGWVVCFVFTASESELQRKIISLLATYFAILTLLGIQYSDVGYSEYRSLSALNVCLCLGRWGVDSIKQIGPSTCLDQTVASN